MIKTTKELLKFWEEQMKHSHRSSNYFFRKSPSHYHMMLIVMAAYKEMRNISVEELKTQLFKTSRPKSALIINEACEKGFFVLEKTSIDQRKKNIKPTESFVKEFDEYLTTLKNITLYPTFFIAAAIPAIVTNIESIKSFLSLMFNFFL